MTALPAPKPELRVETAPDLDELGRTWQSLDRTGSHSFFVSWTWIGTWLRTLPAGATPKILIADGSTGVCGAAVLGLRTGRVGRLLPVRQVWMNSAGDAAQDCITIEHNGFAGHDPDTLWSLLMEWFAVTPVDELVVPGVALTSGHEVAGLLVRVERRNVGYRSSLASVGDGGVETLLSRNARQQLRRSMRSYEKDGPLGLDVAGDVTTALDYFSRLKDLHVRSWTRRGKRHAFDTPHFEIFHHALIEAGVADGSVQLLRIAAGDRVLGYLYNFCRAGVVSSYQSGFDDEDSALRPGYVSHALAIAHYAKAGFTCYDFLAGSNRLKETFGRERYELSWCRFRKPKAAFRAEALARGAVEFIRQVGK